MNILGHKPEFKIIFLGNTATGKTSIIMRYQHNFFADCYNTTIAAAFVSKTVATPYGEANLHMWDTAGQEKYRSCVPMYTRGAVLAIVVFDVSDKTSFDDLHIWIDEVRKDNSSDCIILLVGNKIDLQMAVSRDKIAHYAESQKINFVLVSAKTGEGIPELFNMVGELLPSHRFRNGAEEINVKFVPKTAPKQESCC